MVKHPSEWYQELFEQGMNGVDGVSDLVRKIFILPINSP
jgi:hypothetical protein